MEKKLRLLKFVWAFLILLPVCANATTIDFNDHQIGTIQNGENYDQVTLHDSALVNMIGGSAQSIYSYGSSSLKLQGGNVTGWISAYGSSNIIISGGTVDDLELYDSVVVSISGGNIIGALGVIGPNSSAMVHIYGKNFNHTPPGANGWSLSGNWANNNSFTILFRTSEPFPGSHLILHTIPEPITLSLLLIGSVIITKFRG